jgi:hypothetical protein
MSGFTHVPIISINERLPTPAKADATLTLSLEARQKSRQRVTLGGHAHEASHEHG